MVAESLVSMLPTPRPAQFPGDPQPPQLFPGWSSVRVKRVGNRQGYRLQPSLTPMWSTGSSGAPPHLTCVRCLDRAVLVAAQHCLHLLCFIWAGVKAHPNSGVDQTGELWVNKCSMKANQSEQNNNPNMQRKRKSWKINCIYIIIPMFIFFLPDLLL